MKKTILGLFLLLSLNSFSQWSSRYRVQNITAFGWTNKTVPVKVYSDSTWFSVLFKQDIPDFSNGFWGLSGNAISTNTNFLGSTTNRSFRIRTNNSYWGKFDSLGKFTYIGPIDINRNGTPDNLALKIGTTSNVGFYSPQSNCIALGGNVSTYGPELRLNKYDDGLGNAEFLRMRWAPGGIPPFQILTASTGTGVANGLIVGTEGDMPVDIAVNNAYRWTFEHSAGNYALYPGADNIYNIGAYGTAVKDINQSGTHYIFNGGSGAADAINIGFSGNTAHLYSDKIGGSTYRDLTIGTVGDNQLTFAINNGGKWYIGNSSLNYALIPFNVNAYDIGLSSVPVRNIYMQNAVIGQTMSVGNSNTLTAGNSGTIAVITDDVFQVTFLSDQSSPAASNTYYLGPIKYIWNAFSAANNRYRLPVNCTLVNWTISNLNVTANGTSENTTLAVRVNNTTDNNLSTTLQFNGAFDVSGTSSTQYSAGDLINIKIVTPGWVTPPINTTIAVTLWFKQR